MDYKVGIEDHDFRLEFEIDSPLSFSINTGFGYLHSNDKGVDGICEDIEKSLTAEEKRHEERKKVLKYAKELLDKPDFIEKMIKELTPSSLNKK